MTDTILYFILTFICTFFMCNILPSKMRWIVLLIGSISFYLIAAGKQAFLLTLIPIFCSYLGGLLIFKTTNEKLKKPIMVISVIAVAAELIIFKLTGIYALMGGVISEIFNINPSIINNIVIPLGLSYYSLILIAYVIDIYWDISPCQPNFFKFMLFGMFSPYITMGPVVRYNEIKDELYSREEVDFNRIKFGIFRILWGLAKKVIIADRMTIFTNAVFYHFNETSCAYIILETFAYSMMFYIDFSSAMDIGLGAAECFGIKLPENFRNPFFSRNFQEVWQRWHITFHVFLRDAIFFTVKRSRVVIKFHSLFNKYKNNRFVKYLPFFICYVAVWIVSGFWHCIEFKYILPCCVIPLIAIVIEDLFITPTLKTLLNENKKKQYFGLRAFNIIYLQSVILLNNFFFNSPSIHESCKILKKILFNFNFDALPYTVMLDKLDIAVILIGIAIVVIVDILKEIKVNLVGIYVNLPLLVRWGILCSLITLILSIGIYGPGYDPQDFVYLRF